MEFRDEIEIAAPVDVVWRLTLDVERWPEMMPTITSVDLLDKDPLRPGSRARIRQPGLPPRTWTVIELEAPRRFSWGTRLFGTSMVAVHEVTPADGGCRNTLTIGLSGPGARLMGRMSRAKLRQTLATENRVFKADAETAAQGSARA